MKNLLYTLVIFSFIFSNNLYASNGETAGHLAKGTAAALVATGKVNVLGMVSTLVGKEAKKAGDAASFGSGFFYYIAFKEFSSATESFRNSRKMRGISNAMSDGGQAGEDVFANDTTFNNFINEEGLDDVFGQVPNPQTELDKLIEMGYSDNPDGSVNTPDGKTINETDISKAASENSNFASKLKGIKSGMKKLDTKNKRYLAQRLSVGSSGGFSNQTAKSSDSATANGFNFNFAMKRKPASAFGPLTYIKGDPIGAQGDNVFHIIERAYENMLVKKSLKQPTAKKPNKK